ncbi:MAG: hypothetical protein QM704_13650 [Anaeromyxobacteraceae bacterium]
MAPTTAIRDQWLRRLGDFLPEGAPPPAWATTDLRAPGVLTSVTYQALHRGAGLAAAGEPGDEEAADAGAGGDDPELPTGAELEALAAQLRAAGVGTLVLDEAHHLRQAWWKALTSLAEALGENVTVVSLTATPPYDVTAREWRRYEALCGPIDEEISAPELVRSGALCPHLDLVWAVEATAEAAARLERHEARVRALFAELLRDEGLLQAVRVHPWLVAPDPAEVLEDVEAAVALLAYCRARGVLAGDGPLLALLGVAPAEVPALDLRTWTALLDHHLHGEAWAPNPARLARRDALARRLRAERLLHGRSLRMERPATAEAELSASPSKLDACVRIHTLEAAARGTALRQVFLADHIREEEPAAAPRLGAWPIFRALAAAVSPEEHPYLALVTGRLTVVHRALLPLLGSAASEWVTGGDLPEGFVRLSAPGSAAVHPLTLALEDGALRVLVGTRALLGEGWDAPAVNSLVLATYAGSFVLTNQLRGRAIRHHAASPDKVASIWHLVAIAPRARAGWHDLDDLSRRFDSFVGLDAEEPVLESGLARLRLPPPGAGWIAAVDETSALRLRRLDDVRARWRRAVGEGHFGRVLPAVEPLDPPRFRRRFFRNTLTYLLATAATAFGAGWSLVMRSAPQGADLRTTLLFLGGACAIGLAFSLPALARAAVGLARHLPVDGSVRELALALRDALVEAGVLHEVGDGALRVNEVAPGEFAVSLAGASYRDSSVYADCLDELLGQIENPRFLLEREGDLPLVGARSDFHAVPAVLGAREETARLLLEAFRRRIGTGRLHPTRTAEGRQLLLRARARAFSATFTPRARRLDRWQ